MRGAKRLDENLIQGAILLIQKSPAKLTAQMLNFSVSIRYILGDIRLWVGDP